MHPDASYERFVDRRTVLTLARASAGLLALLVAWIHLLHPRLGFGRLLVYLEVGTLYDPRPPLFVAASLLVMVGVGLGLLGSYRRQLYLGGIALMIVMLVGYVAWHTVLDHGGFWPHLHAHAHDHHGVVETMVIHLANDRVALVSKVSEVVLLVLLLALYHADRE